VVAEFAIDARRSQEERLLEARLQYDILTRKLS
jgi:hypothetical protein